MWVAQITEPAPLEEAEHYYETLTDLFPCYKFSVMGSPDNYKNYFVIACPHPHTVQFPEDVGTEVQMLQFIITELIYNVITDHEALVLRR